MRALEKNPLECLISCIVHLILAIPQDCMPLNTVLSHPRTATEPSWTGLEEPWTGLEAPHNRPELLQLFLIFFPCFVHFSLLNNSWKVIPGPLKFMWTIAWSRMLCLIPDLSLSCAGIYSMIETNKKIITKIMTSK